MTDKTDRDTLLAHIAGMFSSRSEDIAVEALAHILKAPSTRSALEDALRQGGAEVGSIAAVRTQVTGEGGERPDLVGFDRNGRECVMIEAKFWAGLTENQPNAYLNRLPLRKALLFVAPASRIEPLWDELRRRARVDGQRSASETTEFKSAATGGERRMMLISWPYLLDLLESAADSHSAVEIQQLRGLVNRMDQNEFLPLRLDELSPEFPRRLLGLQGLVRDAVGRAAAAGCADTSNRSVRSWATAYGHYLRVAGKEAWFGIDHELWAQGSYPDTPLWLELAQSEDEEGNLFAKVRGALEPLVQRDPPRCFDNGNALFVPVMLPTGVERDVVLDAVVECFQETARLIEASD